MERFTLHFFLCLLVILNTSIGLQTQNSSLLIRKCCSESQELNWHQYKCVDRPDYSGQKSGLASSKVSEVRTEDHPEFPWWMDSNVTPLSPETLSGVSSFLENQHDSKYVQFGAETCFKRYWSRVYSNSASYNLLSNGSLIYHTQEGRNITLLPTSYCADKDNTSYAYMLCPCSQMSCIYKCCPDGQILRIDGAKWDCVAKASNATYSLGLYKDTEREELILKSKLPRNCHSLKISAEAVANIYRQLISDTTLLAGYPFNYCGDITLLEERVPVVIVCLQGELHGLSPSEIGFTPPVVLTYTLAFSAFLLALTLVVFAAIPETRNTKSNIIICHIISLLIRNVTKPVAVYLNQSSDTSILTICCIGLTYNFFRLAAAFWINVLCFDIASTFRTIRPPRDDARKSNRRRFILYSLYAWGGPALVVTAMVVRIMVPEIPDWWVMPRLGIFTSNDAEWAYNYGPMLALSIANTILLGHTIFRIAKAHCCDTAILNDRRSARHDGSACLKGNTRWVVYVNLLCLMGPPRTAVITSWAVYEYNQALNWNFLLILITCTDLIQSVGLFLFICCRPRVRRSLLLRLRNLECFFVLLKCNTRKETITVDPADSWRPTSEEMEC